MICRISLEQVFKIGGQRIACLMQMSNHLVQIVAEARKLRMYEPRHVFVGSFLRREATLSRSSATRPKCTGRMPKASKAGLPGEMEAKTRTGRPFRSAVAVIARIGGCGGSQHPILASERFLGWQLRMTPALRRQRSHVRIVSGAPTFLCFTTRYADSD
jgi:hypothetical protein